MKLGTLVVKSGILDINNIVGQTVRGVAPPFILCIILGLLYMVND